MIISSKNSNDILIRSIVVRILHNVKMKVGKVKEFLKEKKNSTNTF